MSSRPRPTLADYIVIALSPALIMLLVGSLVFFLIEVFYQGAYDSRLTFIMAMFVMAAVLIARISIEQSREYALLFAIPLAAVTAIATFRFVEFSGPLKSFSPIINLGLIGLIWWCADRLTWDSTVIDESKDASGEGLLQTAGLDADATTQNAAAESNVTPQQPRSTLWQRFMAYRRRPHSPGVWVIYFSLAALPIFGFGHWFIPSEDLDARRYVFKLLVGYVASALGLLLTTSFLNLRRYLRQRRLEMPLEMAGTWIGTGAAMIVALLLVCTLLPRRNPEYSITQLPMFAGSPTDLWTTEYSVGNEGQENPEKADRTGEQQPETGSPEGPNQQQPGGPSQGGDSQGNNPQPDGGQPGKQSGGPAGQKPEATDQPPTAPQSESPSKESGDQSPPAEDKNGKGKSGPKKSGKDTPTKPQSEQQPQSKQDEQDRQPRRGDEQPQPKNDQGNQKRQDEQQPPQQKSQPQQPQKKKPQQKTEKKSGSPPQSQPTSKFDPSKIISAVGGTIGQLLKLLYWVVALAIIGYVTWKYWRQIREALANFWKSLREFWESLFGRKPVAGADAASALEAAPPPISFAAFHDPFLTGMAQSQPPVEVIRYSFEALEAWAREHGCARGLEQTPQEFVQRVGAHQVAVAREVATLAEMYNRCAYARDLGQRINIEPLRRLWEQLRESLETESVRS